MVSWSFGLKNEVVLGFKGFFVVVYLVQGYNKLVTRMVSEHESNFTLVYYLLLKKN